MFTWNIPTENKVTFLILSFFFITILNGKKKK